MPELSEHRRRQRREASKRYRLRHPEKVKEHNRKNYKPGGWKRYADDPRFVAARASFYQKAKYEVLWNYSCGTLTCACCGEAEYGFLTLDHVNNDGAAHRRALNKGRNITGGGNVYYDLRRRGFPEGFQVLCYNCNCTKGYIGCCPHQLKPTYPEQLELPLFTDEAPR
jgi:hypothetical protein